MTDSAPASPQGSSPTAARRKPRNWPLWVALTVVAAAASGLIMVAVSLRDHADQRRNVMVELTALEVAATAQHTVVWRAMTQLMADERMDFIRIRGEEQQKRQGIYARLEALKELEADCATWDSRLGNEAAPELLAQLEEGTHRFLSGIQGAMGMMNLSSDRMRARLKYWDMNFGEFEAALEALRARDGEVATAAASVANRVTMAAALITLFASMLLVLGLGRVRARRTIELQKERLDAVAASESRFRELVQNSSDLIVVLEPGGSVRYATPSAGILSDAVSTASCNGAVERERSAEEALRAATAIERAIQSGAHDEAIEAAESLECSIDSLIGLSVEELLAQENTELTLRGADGSARVFDVRATDLTAHQDIQGIVLNARDITDAKRLEEELRHQALHDPLTGLPNRRRFAQRFDEETPEERESAAVLFIDLDGFKLVNDSYGHGVGDQLLIHTAARIGTCLGERDLLARQGGDEFIVLCSGLEGSEDGGQNRGADIARRIQAALAPPFELGKGIGHDSDDRVEVFISASMGVVTDLVGIDAEQAAQRADIAMYRAKAAGKAQAIVFSEEMLEGAPERLALETDFRHALERDEFTVVYQPKVGLKSGVTESLEALVRWIHPTRGFVGPDLFIPFAEESGLVMELGRVILEKACMDAVRWQQHNVVVAVNLSPIQFRNPNLVDEVRNALEMSGLDPKFLELEITESAVLGDVENTIRVMNELKTLGIRLAIDDFGTGYSNLAHLKHFNVDVLKIDQAFVRGGNGGPLDHLSDGAIVEAVIGMAKAFKLHVVAEGVESINHADELRTLGADLGQGFYFSRPVSGEGIDEFLAAEFSSGVRQPATAV
ncbi:Cyclic di-GMP phosphodiesterase Gmr [Planctomycetes bacterium Poly30]|uniref:Cyclic di-GMP phosphodiesterase Gmr n=1 Tax=Saltatorellus ferox TaxID=2528018 RepID=A0A518ENP2_9BACT|nr:Cyclic di-GMP phosphodiesterase Gmr [Planctomycetes bacterium Poly30]